MYRLIIYYRDLIGNDSIAEVDCFVKRQTYIAGSFDYSDSGLSIAPTIEILRDNFVERRPILSRFFRRISNSFDLRR